MEFFSLNGQLADTLRRIKTKTFCFIFGRNSSLKNKSCVTTDTENHKHSSNKAKENID